MGIDVAVDFVFRFLSLLLTVVDGKNSMIRFGIAGFGLHAVRRLMPGFALAQNCTVTALSRRDMQKAREAAAQYNIPHVFASTEELCRSTEVDVVLVTSPNVCHLQDVLLGIA